MMSPNRSCLARVQRRLLAHFAVDPRALTLFRLAMGIFALIDLTLRLLPSHGLGIEWYCSPPYLSWAPLDADDTPHTGPIHKIMFFRGPVWLQGCIFASHFLVIFFFILSTVIPSQFTRQALRRWLPPPLARLLSPLADEGVSATLSWLLTMLMHGRTDEFNDASDKYYRLLLIWVQFFPFPTAPLSAPAAPLPRTGGATDGSGVVQWPFMTALALRLLGPVYGVKGVAKGSIEGGVSAQTADTASTSSHRDHAASGCDSADPSKYVGAVFASISKPTTAPSAAPAPVLNAPVLSVACVGLQWQAAIIYVALVVDRLRTGYWEWMSLEPHAATAVHHVLSGSLAVRRLGSILARLPYLTRAATLSTNPAELIGGVLLLAIPAAPALEAVLRRRRALKAGFGAVDWLLQFCIVSRVAGAALLASLQLSLAAALRLPYFQAVSIFALLPTLPAAAMDAADSVLERILVYLGPVQGSKRAGKADGEGQDGVEMSFLVGDGASNSDAGRAPTQAAPTADDSGSLRARATRAGSARNCANAQGSPAPPSIPASAASAVIGHTPRPSACARVRSALPWLLLVYANLLVLAYDFRVIPPLPDNGDIGHYLPAASATVSSSSAPLPLPFDAFPAIHGGDWAHPADATARPQALAAAAAGSGVQRSTAPTTRDSAIAEALSLSQPHAAAFARRNAEAASSAKTAAVVPAYAALPGDPSRARAAGTVPPGTAAAIRRALATAAAHSLESVAVVVSALRESASSAAAAARAGLLTPPPASLEAASAAAGKGEGVWEGGLQLGEATLWGLVANASRDALAVDPISPAKALSAIELESGLASGADRTPGPWGVQATEKHRSWRLERLLWLTHERFPRADLRARRARSFARLWCKQWGEWLGEQRVQLPENSRRLLRLRAVGYIVDPPVFEQAEESTGLQGLLMTWFRGVDVQRRREAVEHDVIVECLTSGE